MMEIAILILFTMKIEKLSKKNLYLISLYNPLKKSDLYFKKSNFKKKL